MANPNQSVRSCILKVDIKCCTGCQKKATIKLESISGVSAVEYNQDTGLITVTGDVEPLTLVHKFTKWGKKAELVSVKYQLDDDNDDDEDDDDGDLMSDEEDTASENISNADPREKKKKKSKCFVFRCFGKKSKVDNHKPFGMQNINWHVPSKFQNAPGFAYATTHPPFMQPQVPMRGAAMPISWPPPSTQSYIPTVNSKLHYQG